MKMRMNNKGISLIEILAGIPIATLLFAALIMAMMHFIKTYQETKLFLQLQEELYQTVEYMRYGYAHEPETEGEQIIGLLTARDVRISAAGNYIEIYPLLTNQTYEGSYWTRFTVNDDHQMEVRAQFGNSKSVRPIVIFPMTRFSESEHPATIKQFGHDFQFSILNPREIWSITEQDEDGNPLMVNIQLEGQVRFRERQDGQNETEDLEKNTRSIVYETSVFLGNAGQN